MPTVIILSNLIKYTIIFLYNEIPEGMLKDEIIGFNPVLIEGDVKKVV